MNVPNLICNSLNPYTTTVLRTNNAFLRRPWWSSSQESIMQCQDTGLILGWGAKFPHAMGQLSPHATTREDYMLQWKAHTPSQGQYSQKNTKQTKCLSTAKDFILATVISEAR